MSKEIKIGEYVRTENGYIGYVENINDFREPSMKYAIEMQKSDLVFVGEEDIKAHSSNIIDLIEVGDYVNGYKVELSRYNELYVGYVYCGGIGVRTTEAYATFIKDMEVEDIEGIITREQFERMEYKVNE